MIKIKRRRLIITVCILLLVCVVLLFGFLIYLQNYPKDQLIPDKLLLMQLNIIGKSYGNPNTSCELNEGRVKHITSNESAKRFAPMTDEQSYVYLNFLGGPQYKKQPIEIYAMCEIYLYLRGRTTYRDIFAIVCGANSGGWFDIGWTGISITFTEFEQLYAKAMAQGGDAPLKKRMGDIWAEENFYNRYMLQLEDKSLEEFMTYWNPGIESSDQKFEMFYLYSDNIMSIGPRNENRARFEVYETGYVYGAWGEDNTAWLLGETMGFFQFVQQGDAPDSWVVNLETDPNQAPEILRRVYWQLQQQAQSPVSA